MKQILSLLFFLVSSHAIFGQQIKTVRDIGFWGGVNVEKKLSKNFEINLEQQLRFYNNLTELDDYLVQFGAKYKINKHFKIGADLRYTRDAKRFNPTENNYRYNLDLDYRIKLSKKLKLSYRLRYQQAFVKELPEYGQSFSRVANIRNKIKMNYKLNDNNSLHFSAELFRRIEAFRTPYFNQFRLYIGNEFKTKTGKFNFALGYEQEVNTEYPLTFFFLKTTYTLKI